MENYLVYKHTTPDGKVYIGMTGKSPEKRWKNGGGYYKNEFAKAIQFFGWENIKHEIIKSGMTEEEACVEEEKQIAIHKSNNPLYGYNKSTGGKLPGKGVKHSDEWKKRHSEFMKNYSFSPERSTKISESKKGKTNGLEGKLGKDCSHAGLVFQIDEKTGNIINVFHGYDEMARLTGFAKTPIRETVSGKRKRAYGYLWEYEKRKEKCLYLISS